MRRALILLLAAGLLVAGCTYPLTISPDGAATAISNVVSRNTKVEPIDITCPTDVMATVGRTFSCHYLIQSGQHYVAHLRVTKVHGTTVSFYISTALDH